MQIVIDIPESWLQAITESSLTIFNGKIFDSIRNGISLPKGHGRLIDADALYDDLIFPNEQFGKAFKDILNDAPTIIPAESEEVNEQNKIQS